MDKDLIIKVNYIDENLNSVCRLILSGRITAAASYSLQHKLEGEFRRGRRHFLVNMRDVDYLSSAGIRVLLEFYQKSKTNGGNFAIERPSESVSNVLGMTALDKMLVKR